MRTSTPQKPSNTAVAAERAWWPSASSRISPAVQNDRAPRKAMASKDGSAAQACVLVALARPSPGPSASVQSAADRRATMPGSPVCEPSTAITERLTTGSRSITSTAMSTVARTRVTALSGRLAAVSRSCISSMRRAESACMIAALLPNWLNGVAKLTPASAARSRIENSGLPVRSRRSAASSTRSWVVAVGAVGAEGWNLRVLM